VLDLHLDGTEHDPDVVGPQLDIDEMNEALTTREYVCCVLFVSRYWSVVTLNLILQYRVGVWRPTMPRSCSSGSSA